MRNIRVWLNISNVEVIMSDKTEMADSVNKEGQELIQTLKKEFAAATEKLKNLAGNIKEVGGETQSALIDKTKKFPLCALGIACTTGLLLGMFIKK